MTTDENVFDEAHTEKLELDPSAVCEGSASPNFKEGKTSRGNQKVVRDVMKHPNSKGRATSATKVRGYAYDMAGHTRASVERYLELAGKPMSSLQPVATPCLDDHLLDPHDDVNPGRLKEESAKIVLKALYVARYNRVDFLWSVNALAREVTKWTVNCDKRLHRLMCYMHYTAHLEMQCWVGDPPEDLQLALFADASFAGWLNDSKSTSGAILCLMGPNTYVPISWFCKKQGSISNSSTESELISLDAALRTEGIPALELWDTVLDVFVH